MTTRSTPSTLEAVPARESFLRLVLKLDAVATAAVGLLSAGASMALDTFLGLPLALLVAVGVFLLVYAAFVWRAGARRKLNRGAVQLAVVINLLYTAACLVVMASRPFPLSTWGVAFVLAQAVAVALFAVLQLVGLRRSNAL